MHSVGFAIRILMSENAEKSWNIFPLSGEKYFLSEREQGGNKVSRQLHIRLASVQLIITNQENPEPQGGDS